MGKVDGYKRAGKVALILVFILGVTVSSVAASSEEEGGLTLAKELYEEGDYISSAEILETIEPRTAEIIYWLWKNEKEIGRVADPTSRDPASPQHKYYLYAQSHPEYLTHDEAFGGDYTPTRKRYEELKAGFPRSEYTGTVFFELIEYDYVRLSEDGLDEGGRLALISEYQRFINRYPQHPYAAKAKEEIGALEKKEGVVGGGSMLLPYEKRFNIDEIVYELYINKWLGSGWYREYPIEILVGKEDLDRFNIPGSTKKGIQTLLKDGYLIVISEAAFQKREWLGPKFLVFESKEK